MKIVVLLEDKVSSGGAFNQALNAIVQMKRICENRFEFAVCTTSAENIPTMRTLGVIAELVRIGPLEKLISRCVLTPWWQSIQGRLRKRLILSFEKQLARHGADLVYFVNPSPRSRMLQQLNYIVIVWDCCHRDTPEFPEIREFDRFQVLDRLYKRILAPSVVTLTDSAALADNISRQYGVDRRRLLPMPFSPAPLLAEHYATSITDVLSKYQMDNSYFFYPSQFWAHKNHIRILEALLILRQSGQHPVVVFAGGDMGNRKMLERFVTDNNLMEQVKFLGFVPAEDMRGLYSGCRAVVMPTYFGPTNLPPLEAWMMGKPLIYSSHLHEQAGDAAILVDPDNADDLAEALKAAMDDRLCTQLVEKGYRRLKEIEAQRTAAEAELLDRLVRFERRSRCWGAA